MKIKIDIIWLLLYLKIRSIGCAVQLDCHQSSGGGLPDVNCNFAQDVDVSIDLNNDGRFDETEGRIPHRWPLRSSLPLGIFDFEIEIPVIDRRNIITGPHRMRILVMPSEEYRKKCGNTDYRETREYTINIIPRTAYRGNTLILILQQNYSITLEMYL